MKYNSRYKFVLSIDESGMIEFWDDDYQFPEKTLKFELISDTQYIEIMDDAPVLAVNFNHKGDIVGIRTVTNICFFEVLTGKLLKKFEIEVNSETESKVETEISNR